MSATQNIDPHHFAVGRLVSELGHSGPGQLVKATVGLHSVSLVEIDIPGTSTVWLYVTVVPVDGGAEVITRHGRRFAEDWAVVERRYTDIVIAAITA